MALFGVEFIVIVEVAAQFPFDQNGPCHAAGEALRVISQRVFEFRQNLRRAGGGVDALHLGGEHRGGDCLQVGFPQRGFLAEFLPGEAFDQRARHHLFKGPLGPRAVVVIHALQRRAVGAQRGEVIRMPDGRRQQQG